MAFAVSWLSIIFLVGVIIGCYVYLSKNWASAAIHVNGFLIILFLVSYYRSDATSVASYFPSPSSSFNLRGFFSFIILVGIEGVFVGNFCKHIYNKRKVGGQNESSH